MNTRANLKTEIISFLENDEERIMIITGTHQYEKHMELLRILNQHVKDGTKVLFRINGRDNIDSIFQNKLKSAKLNTRIKIGKLRLYIDTINRITWKGDKYNVSVIYPIDSVCRMKEEQRRDVINNLLRNTVHKLFIVSWTDRFDYNWLNEFGVDRRVAFDAEEEDNAYHNRVLDNLNS